MAKSSKGISVWQRESWIIEAVPPPPLAGLWDSEKLKEGGEASMSAAAFSESHVSVRNRQDSLLVLMKSLMIKVFGVRDLTFHKAIERVTDGFSCMLSVLMGLKF